MIERIKNHILENPGYTKWGVKKLANKYGCAERTMRKIMKDLSPLVKSYASGI